MTDAEKDIVERLAEGCTGRGLPHVDDVREGIATITSLRAEAEKKSLAHNDLLVAIKFHSGEDHALMGLRKLVAERDAALARAVKVEAALAERDKNISASKSAFEAYIRELRRENLGDHADELTEADFILDFAEPAWPDYCRWSEIWGVLNKGGELTPEQRIKALAYEDAGEEYPADAMRLDPCANNDCPLPALASLTEGE